MNVVLVIAVPFVVLAVCVISFAAKRIQALKIENSRLKHESDANRTNLEALVADRTQQLKISIANLERSFDITLAALGDALDYKDVVTKGHSSRVTAYAIAIARSMGLPKEQILTISRGAYLHDLGKIKIPDDILKNSNKLTKEEYEQMKEHCYYGYKMLSKIPFLSEAAEIAYCHHEHYDGSGYPRSLLREQIPLGARIVAIANTLDSITSDLPYRRQQPMGEATAEIKRCAGTQFDPHIVDVFLQIPDVIWSDLRRQCDDQKDD